MLLVATLALLGVWRLAMRLVGSASVAFWTVLLTGLYPIWFAQSSLAQADIFAAACSLWGLNYALPRSGRKPWAAALWFAAAALSKETSIAIPLTLVAINLVAGFRSGGVVRTRLFREAAWLSSCVLPLAAWYAYHYAKTGFLFGNPEFLRYNAEATLTPLRILAAFGHRILHLTAHMNLFVPVLMASPRCCSIPAATPRATIARSIDPLVLWRIFFLLLVEALLFSVLGGALLTRYLLPMYPLVLLAGRDDLVPPRAVLARARAPLRRGIHRRALRRSALRLRAGRQSGLRARDPHAPGRHRASSKTRSRRDGAHGLAHERRADKARAGLREAAVGGLRHRRLYRRRD